MLLIQPSHTLFMNISCFSIYKKLIKKKIYIKLINNKLFTAIRIFNYSIILLDSEYSSI